MLTRLRVRNFKNLEEIDIPLGRNVVFVGPNNSGKTSALQALSLWRAGVVACSALAAIDGQRPPVATINRFALTQVPVTATRFFWRNGLTAVRRQMGPGLVHRSTGSVALAEPSIVSDPIPLEIEVFGQTGAEPWQFGLSFFHPNEESIECQPIRGSDGTVSEPPEAARSCRIAMLPAMSGLVTEEPEVPQGRIDVLIGEGQTAQVLRNLCLRVLERDPGAWDAITASVQRAFGIALLPPARDAVRGTVILHYNQHGTILDIATAGRGMQQTLLLMAHLHANPGSVLLLDEPDAHLEILRQRDIYNLLTETAAATESQVIAASHSEVILNEAAERDTVIAFVGTPHPLIGRGSQLRKALTSIGFDQYYQASLTGCVLYLEGATDLAVLQALACALNHPASRVLERPFAHYVGNQPRSAQDHFHGLREAWSSLKGFALFDRLDRGLPDMHPIVAHAWRRREIENYIVDRETLLRFASGLAQADPVEPALAEARESAMTEALTGLESASRFLGRDPWSHDTKVSDDVLPPIFANYYRSLGLTDIMAKADYHELVAFKDPATIDPEVTEVLDKLLATIG